MKHNVIFKLDLRKDDEGVLVLEKVPIFAKISFAGDRLNYFTGFRIDANNWQQGNNKKPVKGDQQAKKNTKGYEGKRIVLYSDINKRIEKVGATLTTLFSDLITPPEKCEIIRRLDATCKKNEQAEEPGPDPLLFLPMFRHYIANSRLAGSRKEYNYSVVKHWQRFADKKKIVLSFDIITPDLLRAFETFLLSEKVTVKKTKQRKQARGVNALHTIFAMTRTFWNHATKELKEKGIILSYPFDSYKIPAEVYGDPIYITVEERNKLFNAMINNNRLTQVRDIFIFQCLTGARVGDMSKWTTANIQNNVLSYIAGKTKENKPKTLTVPLSAKAIEILTRYNMPDGRLLPFISDQKYNDYLKELFDFVGLTRTVTRQHPTTREPENVRLCDIVSSHMARRTFVGGLFGKVDSSIISAMSGHVEGSKAFARYHGVSDELKKKAIDLID